MTTQQRYSRPQPICDDSKLTALFADTLITPTRFQEAKVSKHATRTAQGMHGDLAERDSSVVPDSAKAALREAMRLENIPCSQLEDLLWIMAQESSGKVGARNSHSSARGLFQLLRNNYHLNPRGADSFGNAVEECQGGIRYIVGRYRSARNARAFWQKHHWY
jgi:hypothetical protein